MIKFLSDAKEFYRAVVCLGDTQVVSGFLVRRSLEMISMIVVTTVVFLTLVPLLISRSTEFQWCPVTRVEAYTALVVLIVLWSVFSFFQDWSGYCYYVLTDGSHFIDEEVDDDSDDGNGGYEDSDDDDGGDGETMSVDSECEEADSDADEEGDRSAGSANHDQGGRVYHFTRRNLNDLPE
jgi:hypothetical protein